jgi:hypothetical protein
MNDIRKEFLKQKGTFCSVTRRKRLKPRKGVERVIYQITQGSFRAGLDYDKKKNTIAGRFDGTLPETNQGLPWGKWEQFPYLISHKGKTYFRLYNDAPKSIVTTYVDENGAELTLDQAKDLCLASEFKVLKDGAPVALPEDEIIIFNDAVKPFKEAA